MKPDFFELREDDLTYFGFRVEPYFASHIILQGMLDKEKLRTIFDWDTGVRWLQYNYEFFQVKRDLLALEEELRGKLKDEGLSYVKSIVRQCVESGDALIEISKRLGTRSVLAEDKKTLIELLDEYFTAMTSYTPFYSLAMFEKPVLEIAEGIAKKYSKNNSEAEELFHLITAPARETSVEREQEAFLTIAQKDEAEREADSVEHAKKFGWLSIRFFLGDPWSKDDILSRLKNITLAQAQKDLQKRLFERKNREERITLSLEKFNNEDKDTVHLVREVVYLRNQRADYYNESAYHIRPLLMKVALTLEIYYEDLVNISIQEIIEALKGAFEYRKHIEARKKNFIVYHNGADTVILEDKEVEAYVSKKSFLKKEVYGVHEISGRIGFRGVVQGAVKIVKFNEDIRKVNKGDVLVTAMTIPNFMPAMERAGAFVTDEGGITCHAAIVARELGKPCIIGTKIATKVLKDGDMVEVDAEKGVVRILNKTA